VNGKREALLLRGITYFGNFHLTSRLIGSGGGVWFHDGIGTGRPCIDENYLESHLGN
ncbi:hypothetical protein DFH09DRAFT_877876, partial [Mycena vulgaris]